MFVEVLRWLSGMIYLARGHGWRSGIVSALEIRGRGLAYESASSAVDESFEAEDKVIGKRNPLHSERLEVTRVWT